MFDSRYPREDYELGNRIYKLRKKKGISQKELGALLGVSNKAVSKWETGASAPKTENIIKLAEVLDVTTEELLSGKADNPVTIEKLSAQASSMLYKQELSEKNKEDAEQKYKSAKTYLISAFSIFLAVTALMIFVGIMGDVTMQMFEVIAEDDMTMWDIIKGAFEMGFFVSSVFTGFVLLARIIRKAPTYITVILCVLFPLTFIVTQLAGIVMTIPTIVTSVRDIKKYRSDNANGE